MRRFCTLIMVVLLVALPLLACAEAAPSQIVFSADGVTATDERVLITGTTVTINYPGIYELSGMVEDGQIVVTTHKNTEVELVLSGLNLSCASGPVILANTDMLLITVADGTQNELRDSADRREPENDDIPRAAVHASDDMEIRGTGSLRVVSLLGNALHCKDDLTVSGVTLDVDAANDGLRGNDAVNVESGSITIRAKGDGIQSSNTDSGKGHVTIEGGSLSITADKDGIQAAGTLQINGGMITIRQGLGK